MIHDPNPFAIAAANDRAARSADALAADILSGRVPASAAIGRADIYDSLNRAADGTALKFLGTSVKIDAGHSVGVLTRVLYMQPANESGREACAGRSAGCTAACLAEKTGHMSMPGSQRARRRRHASFFADRGRFLADLHTEIAAHERSAVRKGKVAAIRLNGTTDLPWHRMKYTTHNGVSYPSLHVAFPRVHFYEYTKHPYAVAAKGGLPANLSLTFSVNERPDSDTRAAEYLAAGYCAAVVMKIPRHNPPATFTLAGTSYPVLDGDAHDARFTDPSGHIVALSAKGRAKHDTSGFVRSI